MGTQQKREFSKNRVFFKILILEKNFDKMESFPKPASFQDDIAFIRNLAEKFGKEKKFQNDLTYKTFKEKFETIEPEQFKLVYDFAQSLKFEGERLYWLELLWNFCDSDPEMKYNCSDSLTRAYLRNEEYDEKFVKYGKSYVKLLPRFYKPRIELMCVDGMFNELIQASNRIGNFNEATEFCKKKIMYFKKVGRSKSKTLMLGAYEELIWAYYKNGSLETAIETFDKLKCFNLNSEDAKELQFKQIIQTIKNLLEYDDSDDEGSIDVFQIGCACAEMNLPDIFKNCQILLKVGQLCVWKGLLYKNL